MSIFKIETTRLILREILPTDEAGMFALDSDTDVHRYLGNKPVTNIEEIRTVIKMIRQQYIDNGIGRWAVIEKQSNDFIGWAGLKLVKDTINGHQNFYDLGYRFVKKYWGLGLATESASALLSHAFKELQLTEIFAMTDAENVASNNVLVKTGFHFIETFDLDGLPHNWYCRASKTKEAHP